MEPVRNINLLAFQPSVSKETIDSFPKAEFRGNLHLIDNNELLAQAVDELSGYRAIGFDTETRPSFRKGEQHDVALLQLSTENDCYLFRMNKIGLSSSLVGILENKSILKVGLSVLDDIRALRKRVKFNAESFIELQRLCPAYGIKDASLQKIYAIIYQEKISKSQRLTNWEAQDLTVSQQEYAALDAWASLRIFNKLMELPAPSPIQFALI